MTHLPPNLAEKYHGQLPVPVVAIARDLGLSVFETADFADTQSGSIRKENDAYVIYVNTTNNPERKRFTIAHEIAHFLKHKPYLDTIAEHVDTTKQFVGTEGELRRIDSSTLSPEEQKLEQEANKIAGEILMPEDDFRKAWHKSNSIDTIAKQFLVSPSAATIRAQELYGEFLV